MSDAPVFAPRAGAGDPLPRLALPDAHGATIDLTDQALAGSTQVLVFLPGRPDQGLAVQLADAAAALEKAEALLVVIVGERAPAPPPSPPAAPPSRPLHLFDAERRGAAAFGLSGAGVVVANSRGSIVLVQEGTALGPARRLARELHEAAPRGVRRSGAPALLIPDVVEPPLRRRLIAYWESGGKVEDGISSGTAFRQESERLKRRTDVFIQDRELFDLMKARILARVVPEMRRAFCFEAASFEALRVGCYMAERRGAFGRHRDNRTPYTAHRSFAMSLNLNTGEYEGGMLRFPEFGRELMEAEAGGAVVFSCNLLHEALPVTRGRRFALFTFFADAAGAARERQMIAERQRAGHSGIEVR